MKVLICLLLVIYIAYNEGCVMPDTPPPIFSLGMTNELWEEYRALQKQQIAEGRGCGATMTEDSEDKVCEILVRRRVRRKGICIYSSKMNFPLCMWRKRRPSGIETRLGIDERRCRRINETIPRETIDLKVAKQLAREAVIRAVVRNTEEATMKVCHFHENVFVKYEGTCVRLGRRSKFNTFGCRTADGNFLDVNNQDCLILEN